MPVSTTHVTGQAITAVDINALATQANTADNKLPLADPAVTNSRAPNGAAGGGLTGTYPNPGLAPLAVPGGISATGTPSATTFLSGAGVWATPAGGGGAGLPANVVNRTTLYTALVGDLVLCDMTAGVFTVTLPALPAVGALVAVKKIDVTANQLTIVASSTGTTDGDPSTTTVTRNAGAIFEHVGANNWRIVSVMVSGGGGAASPLMLPGPAVNEWIIGQMLSGNASTLLSNGTLLLVPVILSVAGTFDQMGWSVDTIGSAGSVVRLGLWASNASGQPGTLLADAGTFLGTTTGLKQVVFGAAQVLAAGMYWMGGVQQGLPTTASTCRTSNGGGLVSSSSNQNNTTAPPLSYYATGITGALASNPVLISNFNAGSPLISLHRSA